MALERANKTNRRQSGATAVAAERPLHPSNDADDNEDTAQVCYPKPSSSLKKDTHSISDLIADFPDLDFELLEVLRNDFIY